MDRAWLELLDALTIVESMMRKLLGFFAALAISTLALEATPAGATDHDGAGLDLSRGRPLSPGAAAHG